jgi:predicted MFS family arabinose efflux permease
MRGDRYLFAQLFVGILLSVVDASVFCFGLFSGLLSLPPFNFSTSDVNVVSTAGTIMSYFSLPIGVLYDRTSPRVTLIVGATISCLGWLLMLAVFNKPITSVAAVAVCYCVSQLASACFETSSIFRNLSAISLHKGRVVMLQKTFIGLGSSVIACIFSAFFASSNPEWFFLFLAALGLIIGLLGAAVLKIPAQGHDWLFVRGLNTGAAHTTRAYNVPFAYGTVVLAANIVFLFAGDLYSAFRTESETVLLIFGYGCIALVLAFAGMIALMPSRRQIDDAQHGPLLASVVPQVVGSEKVGDVVVGEVPVTGASGGETWSVAAAAVPTADAQLDCPRNDATVLHNVRYPELWALWVIAFAAIGAVVMVTNNVPQLYAAAVGPTHMRSSATSVLVSLFGIGSALGRVAIGGTASRFAPWRFLTIAPIVNVIALPLFLCSGEYIHIPMLLVGLGSGTSWAAIVLNIKALFANDGQHYNYLYTAGIVAPLIFNNWLFATTYDAESRAQHQPNLGVCDGVSCVALPLGICAGVNVVAAVVSIWLNRRLDKGALEVTTQM